MGVWKTYLCDLATWIRLSQTFPQSRCVALQPTPSLLDYPQVPHHLLPYTLPLLQIPPRLAAHQPNQVKMPHDPRLQALQHLILQVIVILKKSLLGTALTAGLHSSCVHLRVVVDGDAVDVVHRPDEVVHHRRGGKTLDVLGERRADELALETDEDVNLGGVCLLQALRFDEVRLVTRWEDREPSLTLQRCQPFGCDQDLSNY